MSTFPLVQPGAGRQLPESLDAHAHTLFDLARDCIITMDATGRVREFNPAAERVFGSTRAEAVGQELAELIVPERLRERHRRGLAHYLETGEGPLLGKRGETAALRRDGSEILVELTIMPLKVDDQLFFTAYLREIAEQVKRDERPANLHLEIAHILLVDLVGYSKLTNDEQIEVVEQLNQIVCRTEQFCQAKAEDGKLITLPTGDGMALVFFQSPEEPVKCAVEITEGVKAHPHIKLRMGVHCGPVNQITDINASSNLAGTGLNVAQRVLDCGDAGHILLSKHVADDLAGYRHWCPYLHDLGECEVKHGLRLHVFNFCNDTIGNPALPQKFKHRHRWKQTSAPLMAPLRGLHWPKLVPTAVILVSVLALFIALLVFVRRPTMGRAPPISHKSASLGQKSIAVLPFENLSDSPQNEHIADGISDEIRSDLAMVADIKVISRSSVMQYKDGAKGTLPDIAKTLDVATVLEGTIQCIDNRVRVTAQLIDARSDTHIWAEHYDRNLTDVFALENELALKIVAQLESKLSPQEKAAIEEIPTTDLAAYGFYVQAKNLIGKAIFNEPRTEYLLKAVDLLEEAVKRDPKFFLAYCELTHAHDQIYFLGGDHTPARLTLADAAIQSALRLRPNAGEAHLALAEHLYWGYLDYDRARQEIAVAQRMLPNNPWPFLLTGYIDRRQSRWEESARNLERALILDPRNIVILGQISLTDECLRQYDDMANELDRALTIAPKDIPLRLRRALVDLDQRADSRLLHATIQAILLENPTNLQSVAEDWLLLALCERDDAAAARAVAALSTTGCHNETVPFPCAWCEGVVARLRGDTVAAKEAFTRARAELEKTVREQPNFAEAVSALGMVDAALGRNAEAVREGRHGVELLPVAKDSIGGTILISNLAVIYAWSGEKDLAYEQLEIADKLPGYFSYGDLRLNPIWDPLRADSRFDKIVASLAPKS